MARIHLVLKLLGLSYLAYLLYALAFQYEPYDPAFSPPFVIWLTDTINLFIHEAGHFFLRPFGKWIYVFGGSFFQVFMPLLLALLGLRRSLGFTVVPAFWCGENMVNVSVYIRDAPYKHLKLIAKGVIHDWNWLLSDDLDSAATIADIVFVFGILLCTAAIALGVYVTIRAYREAIQEEAAEALLPARIGKGQAEEQEV